MTSVYWTSIQIFMATQIDKGLLFLLKPYYVSICVIRSLYFMNAIKYEWLWIKSIYNFFLQFPFVLICIMCCNFERQRLRIHYRHIFKWPFTRYYFMVRHLILYSITLRGKPISQSSLWPFYYWLTRD